MNPLVLAVDTTQELGSLALARGGEILEETEIHEPTGFAHVLYGHLAALLERHGVRPREIDCFAAASGPGSFTGVRVGLACIKGLAEAAGRPAVAVSNLQALATFGAAPLRAVMLDARRGEIYGAVYDAAGRIVLPEVVAKLDSWLETLPAGAELVKGPRPLAAAVARIATGSFRSGEASDPAALDANYVRRSDAELFWKD
ncbi:MAG TPA: tRNA (adenosine(37)-N6)-threonylcarbamoyltransferase complex dimerization subunit type 1 TsaB [Bryobacteraceae bacterium]|nr:tRNA (adenosine(37)-N6)-threonylcarbamoyltransferase complex dimerization subunit type 1 TsaB [Bryobacteraceae bacterium]